MVGARETKEKLWSGQTNLEGGKKVWLFGAPLRLMTRRLLQVIKYWHDTKRNDDWGVICSVTARRLINGVNIAQLSAEKHSKRAARQTRSGVRKEKSSPATTCFSSFSRENNGD